MLTIDSHSAVVDTSRQIATFTIDFSESPDFFTVDEFGRQADSFQFFVDNQAGLPVFRGDSYLSQLDIIVRGEEINLANQVVIRDAFGDNGSSSGGWGPARGAVPFSLNQDVLTFSVPLNLLNDSDGLFSYNLETYEFGASTDSERDQLSVIDPNFIRGTNGTDILIGTDKQDDISGLSSRDIIIGLEDNDTLRGGNGSDTLIGTKPYGSKPGIDEIDSLYGGGGADTFVLGDFRTVYYTGNELADFAFIKDFNTRDVIQLKGRRGSYELRENYEFGARDTRIFLAGTSELIGVVQGVTGLSLTSNDFRFIP